MASVSSQPQFRYTQPPSKVLHLRNLPWECTEEELIELGKPFGKVVNTKCNVGANRNQAFIEFADLNQAIAMISYYASSSEPAQDVAGNVLLVTIEGTDARLVSIDVLHLAHVKAISSMAALCIGRKSTCVFVSFLLSLTLPLSSLHFLPHLPIPNILMLMVVLAFPVFSAFGFVHKITTFEKTAGFQALVQFSDTETASSAKNALDGRSIPRYLLPENMGQCTLRITYSAHTDLSVKFQSHRSRDYTNPYLPVAPSAIDASGQNHGTLECVPCAKMQSEGVGIDGKKLEPESNVLLASIENMQYAVTLDVLHMVFSAFGPVQKIAMFDKNGGLQALIQYPDVQTAVVAKEALEGHCIYDGGFCKLHISYSRHTDLSIKVNNDRSKDYTIPNTPMVNPQPSLLGQQPHPMVGTAAHQYNGSQYPPTHQHPGMHQPSAGWGSAAPAIPQSMPMMNNHSYMPAGTMPQMGPGMMQMPGQGSMPPHIGTMPPTRPDQMQ
ncbi:hypothetical protein Patl1_20317 [Pistacia atlantica]|uniref:Uncharacterized protein n=1 Tax=Pistacia atlantica TaxID=434234 RepID=A0ACC1BNR1_9ROSI|nr:hypothetical protein Patl1_20317 [Pistacia atlantica]